MKVRIGTRKSKLALAQTEMFANALKKRFDDIDTEIVCISTKGDKILDKPLAMIGGKGVFISELENALLSGAADMAVHSAKDLPLELADGLEISSALQRGNYRDVLVTRKNEPIKNEEKFIVGTGSLRRRGFIKKQYPLVQIKDIRGNVDTRINKPVSYTHLRAHETGRNLVCRLLLEKKKKKNTKRITTRTYKMPSYILYSHR